MRRKSSGLSCCSLYLRHISTFRIIRGADFSLRPDFFISTDLPFSLPTFPSYLFFQKSQFDLSRLSSTFSVLFNQPDSRFKIAPLEVSLRHSIRRNVTFPLSFSTFLRLGQFRAISIPCLTLSRQPSAIHEIREVLNACTALLPPVIRLSKLPQEMERGYRKLRLRF
jgi:hypothetical protein